MWQAWKRRDLGERVNWRGREDTAVADPAQAESLTVAGHLWRARFRPMRGCFVSFLMALPCMGATVVTNVVFDGAGWNSNGSHYILEHDITVPFGSDARIGPGVEVLVSSTDSLAGGSDHNRVEFISRGRLLVQGTREQPVTFRALSNNARDVWAGFDALTGSSGTSFVLSNVFVFNAVQGIYFSSAGRITTISGVTLATNSVALRCDYGAVFLEKCRVHDNGKGLLLLGEGATINQCLVYDNAGDAVVFNTHSPGTGRYLSVSCVNNTIYRNAGAGVKLNNATYIYDTILLRNNIIVSNEVGVYSDFGGGKGVEITHCNVFGNTVSNYFVQTNYYDLTNGPGCISAEPRMNADGSLPPESPCVDAASALYTGFFEDATDILGNPRYVDSPHSPNTGDETPNGAFIDMGAYEFQPPLEILSINVAGGQSVIEFPTVPNKEYRVLNTTDFLTYDALGLPLRGSGGVLRVTNAASEWKGFYQVESLP
jgi:hypothetical protein